MGLAIIADGMIKQIIKLINSAMGKPRQTTKLLDYNLLLAFLAVWVIPAFAQQSIKDTELDVRVWHANYDNIPVRGFLQLAMAKAGLAGSTMSIRRVEVQGFNSAFEQLSIAGGKLDVIVSGVSIEKEKRFLPIYVPLDRGLLGFRLCLIDKYSQSQFNQINQAIDFAQNGINIALVNGWPDIDIMQTNRIPVFAATSRTSLLSAMEKGEAQCFSRSAIEAQQDDNAIESLQLEQRLALVYPFADILYVRKDRPELHAALTSGLRMAIIDRSYYTLFEKHYANRLSELGFYRRKLLIMENPHISQAALDAINRLGIASFN